MAISSGTIRSVKAILAFSKEGLLIRDAHGFTALHHAVRLGYPVITQEILNAIPQEGLYLENGVGKTPYEDAQKRAMKPTTESVPLRSVFNLTREASSILYRNNNAKTVELELQKVIATMNRLVSNGILEKSSSLGNSFEKFVSATEGRLVKIKAQLAEAKPEENANPRDLHDSIKTLMVITKVIGGTEAKRTLVHLGDVQRSVATTLKEHAGLGDSVIQTGDGLEEEEDEEVKEKAKMMGFQGLYTVHDYL